jgi:excisionase family DNA binding protein
MPKYLTVAEVAELLRLSPKAVRCRMVRREIPFVKIGRAVRVAERDLLQFLESRTRCGVDEAGANIDART